jgi:hypothetical protein
MTTSPRIRREFGIFGRRSGELSPSFRDGALAPDLESRDSGFDAAHRPGMTGHSDATIVPSTSPKPTR